MDSFSALLPLLDSFYHKSGATPLLHVSMITCVLIGARAQLWLACFLHLSFPTVYCLKLLRVQNSIQHAHAGNPCYGQWAHSPCPVLWYTGHKQSSVQSITAMIYILNNPAEEHSIHYHIGYFDIQ